MVYVDLFQKEQRMLRQHKQPSMQGNGKKFAHLFDTCKGKICKAQATELVFFVGFCWDSLIFFRILLEFMIILIPPRTKNSYGLCLTTLLNYCFDPSAKISIER